MKNKKIKKWWTTKGEPYEGLEYKLIDCITTNASMQLSFPIESTNNLCGNWANDITQCPYFRPIVYQGVTGKNFYRCTYKRKKNDND